MQQVHQWMRATLILAVMGYAASAIANQDMRGKQVREQWSGWTYGSTEADVNGDMEGGGTGITAGNGSLGHFTGGGSSDLGPWDEVSFCDFDETGYPIAVALYFVSLSNIQRYSNGDLVYTQLASSPPSSLCYNFLTYTSVIELYLDIVGGTGRFEGTSGQLVVKGGAKDFLTGFGSQYGTTTGVMYGLRSDRHDKSRGDD